MTAEELSARIKEFFAATLVHLLVISLIALGGWLASSQVPEDTSLRYTIRTNRVGNLSTWYVRLENQTEYAIDLEFTLPKETLNATFDPPSGIPKSWNGQLLIGKSMEALVVTQGSDIEPSQAWLSKSIKATFQARDATGLLQVRSADVRESSTLPVSRSLSRIVWFLAPFLALGGVIFGLYLWKKKKKKSTASQSD